MRASSSEGFAPQPTFFFRCLIALNALACLAISIRLCTAWASLAQVIAFTGIAMSLLGIVTIRHRQIRRMATMPFADLSILATVGAYLLLAIGAAQGRFGAFAPLEIIIPSGSLIAGLLTLLLKPVTRSND